MIAVIGNQSAGKSSLIESISGVTLPRSSGTCTRCPTECRLTYAETPWTCAVRLHFITDKLGAPIKGRVVSFGDAISAKADVEDRIRRAQHAILNPSVDPNTFLDSTTILSGNETSFSRNYVSLAIKGRDLADLSFVDLPGLIASVGQDGDAHDIELVKSLVTSYIEKPSCVILLTVACETDFENQGAHHLAKQFDPEGKRTVGVLTKPDRIPQGEEMSWIRLVQNEVEPLVNNWYCVKQPSSQAIKDGIDWAGARRQEREFFASTKPWCNLDSYCQSFLCTTRLTDRLSTILAELIAKRLPEIQEELYKVLQVTGQELRSLPKEPSGDPVGEVLRVLGNFHKELSERLEGTPDECGLIQAIRMRTEMFKHEIRTTAPEFIPFERNETPRRSLPAMAFLANEEGVGEESDGEESDGEESDGEESDDDDNNTSDDNHISKKRKRDSSSENIYIDDVMKRARRARTRELPDNYPFIVQKNYICEILQAWKKPAFKLFDDIYQILKGDVAQMVDRHFSQMGQGSAKQSVLMTVHEHLDAAAARTKDKIQWLLDLEDSPTTFNTHYYSDYRDKFLAHYKNCRGKNNFKFRIHQSPGIKTNHQIPSKQINFQMSGKQMADESIKKALSALAELGINARPEDLPKLLPADPMEAAIGIMASVRAYFQVAYKRFVDIIPMAIDHEIIRGLGRGLEQALRDGLQLTGNDAYERCSAMLKEPCRISMRRQEMKKKLERLRDARKELRKLSV